MKRLGTILGLIVLAALAYQFRTPLLKEAQVLRNDVQAIFAGAPCSSPIPYTLGTFDTKFGISKSYFLSAVADAEAIWEKPFGKQLFVYAPTDTSPTALKINLVYDYRQAATSKLSSLGIVVNNDRASYDALKAQMLALKAQYQTQLSDFNARVAAFNRSNKTNENEYNQLQQEQQNLNNMVDEINALVVSVNRLASTLNLSVDQYNTINGARGESFEEGVYVTDGFTRYIDIYEFSDRAKLVRVLAHELGHALGLDHVTDPKAIMYKFNQSENSTLTAADLAELKTKCNIK